MLKSENYKNYAVGDYIIYPILDNCLCEEGVIESVSDNLLVVQTDGNRKIIPFDDETYKYSSKIPYLSKKWWQFWK